MPSETLTDADLAEIFDSQTDTTSSNGTSGSNFLDYLTGIVGVGTNIYKTVAENDARQAALKANRRAVETNSNLSVTLKQFLPWIAIGGAVLFLGIWLTRK